ncbi:hypothetical protein AB0K21_21605 [Streptosporangium sp. NPDC049248]|uniref:hypothetical protein n=1 Tax=Streptosporangium sp. NPDC049248 TaxID=3155651 RepID=UPI00342F100E
MSRQRVERMERYQQLLREGVTDFAVLAYRIGVTERTIHRYGHRLAGGRDRRVVVYPEYKPRVLWHLQAYPNSRFSAGELARVLGRGNRYAPINNALRDLQREKLVESVVEPRVPNGKQVAIRWSLARETG